ncbi:hypothetical protein GCM10010360_33860 [Streptomyces nogalater]
MVGGPEDGEYLALQFPRAAPPTATRPCAGHALRLTGRKDVGRMALPAGHGRVIPDGPAVFCPPASRHLRDGGGQWTLRPVGT